MVTQAHTTVATMGSAESFKLAETVVPGGVNSIFRKPLTPVVIRRANGCRLWDAEGREYLDHVSNLGAGILGHCNSEVNEAVFEAMQTLDQAGVGVSTYEIDLALKLREHIPACDQSVLVVTGTEATYHAVRLARGVTGKTDIVMMEGAYHGWHDYVISGPAGWQTGFYGGVLEDALKHTWKVPANDLDAVDDAVKKSGHQVAAILIEPLMMNAGYIPPQPGYYEGLRDYCTENGIVLVFDEIITGFRHHLGGYQAICKVTPDLTTVGKAMANGYPVSAVCGSKDLMMQFNTAPGGKVSIGGTFNGHSAACAAALKTISLLEDGTVHRHIYALGDRLRVGINEIIQRMGIEAFATGFGSTWVVYFMNEKPVVSFADVNGPDYKDEAEMMFRRLMIEHGCWMFPAPRKRQYISAAHSAEDIDKTLETVETVFREMKKKGVV